MPSPSISVAASGLVYRNPRPHLRALNAWHPSIVRLADGTLLSAFDLGQAAESLDQRTYISRSHDGGETWSSPTQLFVDTVPRRTTHSVRLSKVSGETLTAFGGRFYRDDPEEGLLNRTNLGYVPMELIVLFSHDTGKTWSGPHTIHPPLVGPAFEVCHRIVELADGRWLAPTSTWPGWDGDAPHGRQAIALVSYDRGRTWPEFLRVLDQSERGIASWETGLTQLHDGRLLAVVWSFEESSGTSLPGRYVLSTDGRSFGPARENGLSSETAKLLTLRDGRILCLYRRLDRPGLWGALAQIVGEAWQPLAEVSIWYGTADDGQPQPFGYPSAVQLPDGDIYVVYWCAEDRQHVIRWSRLKVS